MRQGLVVGLLFFGIVTFGQTVKEMNPELGKYLDFNPENEKVYQENKRICEALIEKVKTQKDYDKLSHGEKMIFNSCEDGSGGYWDIIGDGCSWYCGGGSDSVSASSELKTFKDISYSASNVHDLSYQTAWVEGVPGYGIGEYLTYYFAPQSPRITTIIVVNGYVKSEKAWKENSRVKQLKVYLNDKPFAILNLSDTKHEQVFKFDPIGYNDRDWERLKSQPPWILKFEIIDVYKGDKYDDTAITQIYFDGIDVHCFAAGTKVLMADGAEKNIEHIQQGDLVMSFDHQLNHMAKSLVTGLVTALHSNLVKLVFDNREITVTDDHPFYLEGGKWASINPDKSNALYMHETNIASLSVGDQLFIPETNQYVQLKEIQRIKDKQLTYTLELDSGTNFIVNGLLVKTEKVNPVMQKSKLSKKQIIDENYQEVIGDNTNDNLRPDKYAMYPNGITGVLQHIAKETRYPMEAQIRKAQGRVVLKLVVGIDGTVQDVKVIQSVDNELDEESVRVIKAMKIWEPGYKNGKPVKVEYIFPIVFRL